MEGDHCGGLGDNECLQFLTCTQEVDGEQEFCLHDDIFPLSWISGFAYILIPFIVGISNVGGIGGGIVKVPILVLMLNYSTASSTNISYPITLGGCLANITLLLMEKHPTQNKPLIDFGIAMILVPAILIGTNTGVLMNQIMASLFLNGFFIVFLCFVCPYLLNRCISLYKLEMEARKELKAIGKEFEKQQLQSDQNSILTENVNILEGEKTIKAILEQESQNQDQNQGNQERISQFNLLQETGKDLVERYKKTVEKLNENITSRNSLFYNRQEYRNFRSQSVQRISLNQEQFKDLQDSYKNRIDRTQSQNQGIFKPLLQKRNSTPNNNIDFKQFSIKEQQKDEQRDSGSQLIKEGDLETRQDMKQNQNLNGITEVSALNEQSIYKPQEQNENNYNYKVKNNSKDQLQKLEENPENLKTSDPLAENNEENDTLVDQEYMNKKEEILREESKKVPLKKILFLLGCLSIVTFFSFVLGNNSIFGFNKCDTGYFIFFTLQYFVLFGLSIFAWTYMKAEISQKKAVGYDFDENDIQNLEPSSYAKISASGFTAGFIAGMLGVGAGLVIVPVLLLLNVNTRVAAATSGFMYFFISFTSILSVLTSGSLSYGVIGWYIMLALLGGSIISPLVYWFVNKYKRQSIVIFIVFLIAFLNIVSSVMYIFKVVELNGWSALLKFGDYCSAGSH